jgi:hypothetical protein
MTLFGIIFTTAIAIIVGIFFYYVFRTSGPWGSLWTFILVLVLAGLATTAWITPYGPLFYDFAWVPTFFFVLFFALLLTAATPTAKSKPPKEELEPADLETSSAFAVLGAFFYIMIILLLAVLIIGIVSR